MRHSVFLDPANRNIVIAAMLLIAALVLGGGGSPHPETELALQLLAGVAAAAWLWTARGARMPANSLVLWVAAIVLALPLIQLIPLPPSIWQNLPGREVQVAALGLVGAADSWQPISTSPPRTLASLLSVIPPLFLLLMTASLNPRERQTLILTIGVMAIIAALLGAVQMAGGPEGPRLYNTRHDAVLTGFHANRNTTADVMLIGILALITALSATSYKDGSFAREHQGKRMLLMFAGAVLVLLACIFTASRAGIALLPPVMMCAFVIFALNRGHGSKILPARKVLLSLIAGVSAISFGGYLLLLNNTALQKVAARFELTKESRPGFWIDTINAIQQYWPIGSGMGTFVPSFIAVERFTQVDNSNPNRAHNDYLEIVLEAGALGIVALALVVIMVLTMASQAWKDPDSDRSQIVFGLSVLGIIAAHSLVDYPLRSMGTACLAAVACGIFAGPSGGRSERTHGSERVSRRRRRTSRPDEAVPQPTPSSE